MSKQLTPRLNRLEPNIIIDGGMEIWPEGTSRSVLNNTDAYGSVLFQTGNTSTGVTLTNSRQASIPSGTNIPFSNQVSKTAAGTLAASTVSRLRYIVEGYDINTLLNKEFSVIFWVKSSVASNRSVSIRNGSLSHSFVQQYNIAQANTWELKVLKFDALNTCPGTLEKTNLSGMNLVFNIVSGATSQTATLNQWVSGNFVSGIGEDTTWLTGTNHDFNIAGVMILPGDWTSLTSAGYQFLRAGRNFAQENEMAQRYYEAGAFRFRAALTSGSIEGAIFFSVEKRFTPTITEDGPTESPNNIHTKGFSVNSTSAAFTINWTADARF